MRRPAALFALLAAVCAAGGAVPGGALAASAPRVAETQELAALDESKRARAWPAVRSRVVARVAARRPLTRGPTVVPVVAHRTSADGVEWLRIRLPGRPNGRTGWITARRTVASVTRWHVVVNTATRRVTAYRGARAVRSFRAIVGKRRTPTPRGRFFVEERLRMGSHEPGAPYALALSARSEVFQEFAGGPGQVAIHGTRNIGGRLGSAVSHGCIRLSTRALTWLVKRIGPGVPVTVRTRR